MKPHDTLIDPERFSEEGAEVQAVPGLLSHGRLAPAQQLDGGEIVILALKPSMWFLVLVSVRWLVLAAAVILLAPWIARFDPAFSPRILTILTQSALVLTALRLIVALLQWSSRLYVLTNRRVMCYRGVVYVSLFEASLVNVRNTYVDVSRVERVCNVGSIGFSLQGSSRVDFWWEQISDPYDIHERIRRAIERALDRHVPY